MRYFLFFLTLGCSLFADTDWDDDSSWSYERFVTYGGMELQCNLGCGDPQYDRNAEKIAYLCCEWLRKPMYPEFKSWWRWKHTKNLNLSAWDYDIIARSDWEGSFERFEEYDDEGMSHGEFLEASSQFLAEIDSLSFDYQCDLQQHVQNLQIIRALEKDGARFIEIGDAGEIEGYDRRWANSISVKRALESEQGGLEWCQESLDRYDQYRDYAEDTFREVDETYRKIFAYCLENHQSEGIAFRAALEDLLTNNLDDALDRIRYLSELAEDKQWGKKLIAKLQFAKGQVENELCLYADAILDLTEAIQNDPSSKEAYLERARAYFETGEFESAFQDFLSSEIKSHPIDQKDVSLLAFASGMISGTIHGGREGITEFIPSLLTSLKVLGSGVWSFVQDPLEVSSEFASAVYNLVQSVQSLEDFSNILIPELKDLVSDWDHMSSFQKGESCGHIIGKYGIDILIPLGAAKGCKAFVELRKASTVHVFETYLKSETNALQIQKKAQLALVDGIKRSGQLKNAKSASLKDEKFTKYALKSDGKVKGFREILGYDESNWPQLRDKIRKGILENKSKFHKIDEYGAKFTVDMIIEGPKGKANVRTGWMYSSGSEKPELITLFICTK